MASKTAGPILTATAEDRKIFYIVNRQDDYRNRKTISTLLFVNKLLTTQRTTERRSGQLSGVVSITRTVSLRNKDEQSDEDDI